MEQYRKLIVAVIGFGAIILKDNFNLNIPDSTIDALVEFTIMLGTTFFIFEIRNDPPKL